MFKASSLLLLTLLLHVQLCSSAPIPARVVQSSGPGPEELAPTTEDNVDVKEPVQEKLIPVVTDEIAPSPKDSPAEEHISVIAKEPEPSFLEDQVSDDVDDADESDVSALQEPLAAAPQESPEEEPIPEKGAFAEASPDENTEEAATAVAVESEQRDPVLVIHLEASEDEAPEEDTEEESAVVVESAVENTPPEQHDLEDPAPEAPIPIILVGASENEASDGKAADEDAPKEPSLACNCIVPSGNAKAEPAEPSMTPEEDKSVVLIPVELETEDASQSEPVFIVPVDPAEQKPDQKEGEGTVFIIASETKDGETPEEHAKEEEVAAVVLEENAEVEEEESVALFPVELANEEDSQVEPAAEQTAPQASASEDPAVIVPLDTAEKEEQVIEESIPLGSPDSSEEEAPEEHTEVEAVGVPVPVVPEENAEEDPAINEEPHPGAPEEEESVALFPVELENEEEGHVQPATEQTAPQKSSPEDPAVIILLDPAEMEPEVEKQEESIPIISPEEEAAGVPVPIVPEDNAEEDPATTEETHPGALEEEESVVLDTEEEGLVEQAAGETVPALETPAVLVEHTGEEAAPEDPILIIPQEGLEVDAAEENTEVKSAATEILSEAPVKPPAPAEAQMVPAPLEGDDGTSMKAHREDLKAATTLIEEEEDDEPVAQVKRGAVLGAAFFTLMCFIIIGIVGMFVLKKLR